MTPSAAHTRIAAPAADSASGTPGTPVLTEYVPGPDTLRTETASGESGSALFPFAATGAAPSEWRDTTSAAIFGAQSTLAEPARIPLAPPPSLTENAVFQSFVLLLAATYAMLLYRNLGDVRTLLGRISRDTATGERLSEDPGGSGYSRFLNIATAIGLLFLGVAAVKYGDTLMPGRLAEAIPQGAVLILSLLASLAALGVAAYQAIAVRLAGTLTLSQPFIAQLMLLKRTYFALGVVLISPPLLLFALCPQGTGGVWFCIVAIELTAAAVLYLKETLNLFLSKKVSILHWFLYLCIVEVFPISLLWLLAVR
ncbi:MAG: DUF4271 domain-containing protein [Alistipes sp.]|jgi:hypothetical protein|uniref:DUF4271 domain-containing protein n=1 Tax=Alistipes sp. TaxID=1872444 RepID=UPI001DF4BB9B|nr:DUF4271 domain-containing protein [Alistipes sp.]MBS5019272.1 DUF4271 domain-containing protein [Alistipes sp.]